VSSVLSLSKPLADYGQTVREWSKTACRPYASQADQQHAPPANWQEILNTCPVPIGQSSGDLDGFPTFADGYWVSRLVSYENISYGDIWLHPLLGGGIGYLVVESTGTEEQIEKWGAKRVAQDALMTAFALTEPHFGSDTSQVSTTAVRDGDSWVLNGTKIFCSAGATGDYVVVFATVDKSLGAKGITAFVVPKGTPGLIVAKANEDKLGLRSWVTSELLFEDCRIPIENRLGSNADGTLQERRSGRSGALGALAHNRPNMSAVSIGLAQASLDLTSEHLSESQVGFASHRWSVIQNELKTMGLYLDRGRRLNFRAQRLVDLEKPDTAASAMAKAYGPQNSERVIRRCMQLLGPEGTSRELLLEKWYRDVKIMDIFEGSGQIQRLVVSRKLMGRAAG
jgi:acyl-CoA dehydrogenase